MKKFDAHLRLVHRKRPPSPNKILWEQRHHWMEMSHHHEPKLGQRSKKFGSVKKR